MGTLPPPPDVQTDMMEEEPPPTKRSTPTALRPPPVDITATATSLNRADAEKLDEAAEALVLDLEEQLPWR